MKSKQTQALEATVAAKKNAVLAIREELDDVVERREKASFEKKPALREEEAHLRAKLALAERAVLEAEAPLPRARELDAREELQAALKVSAERAVSAARLARDAARTAVVRISEACALGEIAAMHARALGGAPSGYALPPELFTAIDPNFFETVGGFKIVGEGRRDVVIPRVAVDIGPLPLPLPRVAGGLVDSHEIDAHAAADLELAGRK